jgi:hypothetical protein
MRHAIATYCSANYADCLARSLPGWTRFADVVLICTDDAEAIARFAGKRIEIRQIAEDKQTGKRINCMRKIDAIEEGLVYGLANSIDYLTWLDADCFVLRDFRKLYHRVKADIYVTRMVNRGDRHIKTVNAGVSFWTVTEKAIEFCHQWRELAIKLEPKEKLNEQVAFHKMVYRCFDSDGPLSVAPVSERKYNLEHEDNVLLKQQIKQYEPCIVHLKGGRWKTHKEFLECA